MESDHVRASRLVRHGVHRCVALLPAAQRRARSPPLPTSILPPAWAFSQEQYASVLPCNPCAGGVPLSHGKRRGRRTRGGGGAAGPRRRHLAKVRQRRVCASTTSAREPAGSFCAHLVRVHPRRLAGQPARGAGAAQEDPCVDERPAEQLHGGNSRQPGRRVLRFAEAHGPSMRPADLARIVGVGPDLGRSLGLLDEAPEEGG